MVGEALFPLVEGVRPCRGGGFSGEEGGLREIVRPSDRERGGKSP